MPRRATIRWVEAAKAWRSDVGDYSAKTGRRKPVYFHEIPNTPKGKRDAEKKLEDHLRKRDRRDADATEDAGNPRVWPGVVKPYLAWFEAQVEADLKESRTLRSHTERLTRWLGYAPEGGLHRGVAMAERLAGSLTDADGEGFVEHLKATGCGPTRVDGVLRSVNACLNWAARPLRGRAPRVILPQGNPFLGLKVEGARRARRRIPERAEMARFLRAARASIGDGRPTNRDGRRCLGCKQAGRKVDRPCRRSHAPRTLHARAVLLLCRVQWHAIARPDELCRATWGEVETPDGPLPGWVPAAHRDLHGHVLGLLRVRGKTTRVTGKMRLIPLPPALTRALERLRASGLSDRWVFPRLTRGEGTEGRWDVEGLSRPVRQWREAAGLGKDFVLYSFRHGGYTRAVGRGGLTADQAGQVGGTSGAVVSRVYLQEDLGSLFQSYEAVRRAGRSK